MGQYFKAVVDFGDEIKVFDSWSFSNGAKLMEHSYIGNHFVGNVYELLRERGPARVAWVGDYSKGESLKRDGHYFLRNVFDDEEKRLRVLNYFDLAWMDGYEEYEEKDKMGYRDRYTEHRNVDYLLNHDRKEFIKVPAIDWNNMQVHPMPILTCSNPGSGGNFNPVTELDKQIFCSWCGDLLEVDTEPPTDEGWTEIPYVFEGDY